MLRLWPVIGSGLVLLASEAGAAVTSGTASGLGLNIEVNAITTDLVPIGLGLSVGPESVSSVTSPSPGSDSDTTASLSASTLLLGSVVDASAGDDLLSTTVSSDVTGVATTGQASASATTNGLGVNLIPLGLTISSTTIGSTSTSSGEFNSLTSSGTSTFEDLAISIGAVNLLAGIDLLNVAPNTELIRAGIGLNSNVLANVSIILNEQIAGGDGVNVTSLTTNALRVDITALDIALVTGLDGGIVIGQSTSSLAAAVPEPSIACSLLVAPVLLLLRRRRTA